MVIYQTLVRKKRIDDSAPTHLAKVLSAFDLTALGIGSTLGVGVYVLAGEVAKTQAGPAVIFSFMIAAIASVFAGLCYAEFGARVPKAGSAYVYCYVTIGEFIAFLIGWNLILEYAIGSASVVKGLSTYTDSLVPFHGLLNDTMPIRIHGLSEFPDIFAFTVTMLFSLAVAFGAKESSFVNNIFTFVNLAVVLFVIIVGSFRANSSNWSLPERNVTARCTLDDGCGTGGFAPYGLSGILKGAATCFYGFIGFDCIATAGEEAKNPRRSIPIAIIGSLFVIFMAYFGISTVLTMALPYFEQNEKAQLPFIFRHYGMDWAVYIVSIGAVAGLCASLMGAVFPLPRIIYAMASDGLIFKWMGQINERFHTPLYGTLFVGALTGLLAMFLDLKQLVDMMSIGTLMAYSIVAACVMLLRYEVTDEEYRIDMKSPIKKNFIRDLWNSDGVKIPSNLTSGIVTVEVTAFAVVCILFASFIEMASEELLDSVWWAWAVLSVMIACLISILLLISRQPCTCRENSFNVPFTPWLPGISILTNTYLMMKLDYMTWVRFVVWISIGLLVYFFYGIRNSVLRSTSYTEKQENEMRLLKEESKCPPLSVHVH